MSMTTSSEALTPRNRLPLFALLSANLISQVGNTITMLAIPWFVLVTTGSAARTGVTAAVGVLPFIVAGIFGGAIVDRLGYARSSVVADIASGVTVALIPLLYHTTGLEFWQLLVLVFLSGILDAPGYMARQSLLPELAGLAGMPLERANGVYSIVDRIAGLGGPPTAGILIAWIGASDVLWIDAVTFGVSAAIVAMAIPLRLVAANAGSEAEAEGGEPTNYLREVRAGFRFMREDRVLLPIILTTAVAGMLAEPVYSVILPVYAREVFGSSVDLGVTYSALAAGSLAGNLIYIALSQRLPRRGTIVTGFAVRALSFWLLIPLPPLAIVAGSIIVNALFLEPANPLFMTILQERVPAGMRARVFGAMAAINTSIRPLGYLFYGVLIERIGLRDTIVVLACVNLITPLTLYFLPALRELNKPHPAPDDDARVPRDAAQREVTTV